MPVNFCFFFSSRRRHTRWTGDWSSDVCSSDLEIVFEGRWRETEDERVVVRPSDPRLDVLGLRSKAVGVEQLHGVAALAQDRSELEQAVGLEDRIALDNLAPFLPHDGIAVEPRRIHEGDLHEAPPQTAS